MTDIPEAAHIARQMYLDCATGKEIHFTTGMTKYQLYYWLDGGPIIDGKPLLEAIARRLIRPRRIRARDRAALCADMMSICKHQISVMAKRKNPTGSQIDRDSRRTAVIMRTLEGLTTLEERNREMTRRKKIKVEDGHSQAAEQPLARDPEELERSLARKLEAIIGETADSISREPQSG
jgi:hypothetical protein